MQQNIAALQKKFTPAAGARHTAALQGDCRARQAPMGHFNSGQLALKFHRITKSWCWKGPLEIAQSSPN